MCRRFCLLLPGRDDPPAPDQAKAEAGGQGHLTGHSPRQQRSPLPPATYQPGPDPLGELLVQGEDVTTLHRQLGPILELHLPRGHSSACWPLSLAWLRPDTHTLTACLPDKPRETAQGQRLSSFSLGYGWFLFKDSTPFNNFFSTIMVRNSQPTWFLKKTRALNCTLKNWLKQ